MHSAYDFIRSANSPKPCCMIDAYIITVNHMLVFGATQTVTVVRNRHRQRPPRQTHFKTDDLARLLFCLTRQLDSKSPWHIFWRVRRHRKVQRTNERKNCTYTGNPTARLYHRRNTYTSDAIPYCLPLYHQSTLSYIFQRRRQYNEASCAATFASFCSRTSYCTFTHNTTHFLMNTQHQQRSAETLELIKRCIIIVLCARTVCGDQNRALCGVMANAEAARRVFNLSFRSTGLERWGNWSRWYGCRKEVIRGDNCSEQSSHRFTSIDEI